MTDTNTPTPWRGEPMGPKVAIIAANGVRAAGMVEPEVAEKILRAVNAHDDLVKALQDYEDCRRIGLTPSGEAVENAKRALAKAKAVPS